MQKKCNEQPQAAGERRSGGNFDNSGFDGAKVSENEVLSALFHETRAESSKNVARFAALKNARVLFCT